MIRSGALPPSPQRSASPALRPHRRAGALLPPILVLLPFALASCGSGCASQKEARETHGQPALSIGAPSGATPTAASTPRAADITVPATPPPPTPGPAIPPASLDALIPWFSAPPYAAALADWHGAANATPDEAARLRKRAAAVFSEPLPEDDPRAGPARFMAAWIEAERPLDPLSLVALAARFERLADEWPLMADVALVRAARLYEAGGSLDSALAVLGRIDADPASPAGSIHRAEALERRASLLAATGKPDEARALLASLADKSPDALNAAAWQTLVSLSTGPEAERFRFELAHRFPTDPLGRAAFDDLDRTKLTPAQRLKLGKALFESHRYDAMRATLNGFVKPSREACEAWVLLGRALERTNRRKKDKAVDDRAFAHYEKALACTGTPRAEATFLGGRNRLAKGDTRRGVQLLEAHVAEFPDRSTADDAELLLAQEAERTSKKPATRKLIETLRRYPTGDMADQVAWAMVEPHLVKRRWAPMLAALDQILALSPDDIPGRHAGRYRYWRGRALWELDKKDEARQQWREVFLRHPLSWYAILAHSRLHADDPAITTALIAEATATGDLNVQVDADDSHGGPALADADEGDAVAAATPSDAAGPLGALASTAPADLARSGPSAAPPTAGLSPAAPTAIPTALWQNAHFRRAVEWARLAGGRHDEPSPFHDLIERELDAVPRAARPEAANWAWLRVEVLQLGGAWSRSMRLARTNQATRPMPFPAGERARPWRLAYPQPFAEYVVRWANERGLSPAWVWAVARVESNFDPLAVSWANAIGLMQIIIPTAQSLVRDTPYEPTRETLMRPAVAVELGTKYLAKLLARHKVIPLASAGYNAGGGAVGKWRRQFGDVDVDEFVERIPYREAHLYAKSVTQTLARYLWLYEGELLVLDLRPVGHPDAAAQPTE